MESYLDRKDKPYSKYINWPSCDSTDWMWRYWGQNYNRLLHIKAISTAVVVTINAQTCQNFNHRQIERLRTRVHIPTPISNISKYCENFRESSLTALLSRRTGTPRTCSGTARAWAARTTTAAPSPSPDPRAPRPGPSHYRAIINIIIYLSIMLSML